MSPPVDVVAYGYDALNRAVSQTVSTFASSSATAPIVSLNESIGHDALGRVDNITNPLDSFTYGYGDSSARVRAVSSSEGPTETLTYQSLPLDPLLSTLSYSGREEQSAAFDYTYNANGQVTSATFANFIDGISYYGYDAWGELETGNGPNPTTTYGYDNSGNLQSESTTRGRTTTSLTFTSNADDQVLTSPFDTSTPQFDGKGNPVSLGGATYTVDSRNRIRSVTKGAQASFFYYDALGHLVHFLDLTNGAVTNEAYLVWCGDRICLSHDANGNPITAYFPQGFITVTPNGTEFAESDYYNVTDKLGSVNQVWESAALGGGTMGWSEYVDAYGDQIGDGVQGDFGFAGYFHHAATGLDFAEHRVYSPQYGRWLTRDPIGVAGGMNLYRYADDDPASLTDRSGNCPWCIGAELGAVGAGVYYAFTAPTSLTWGQFADGALNAALQGAVGGGLGAEGAVLAVEASPALVPTLLGGGAVADSADAEPTPSEESALVSLQDRLQEHIDKLEAYLENPDAFDNKGYLANAADNAIRRQQIIDGRAAGLLREIDNFQTQIDRIKDKSCK